MATYAEVMESVKARRFAAWLRRQRRHGYTGAELRKIRAQNGVGRPPRHKFAKEL